MSAYKYVGLAAAIGLLTNLGIVSFAFAQPVDLSNDVEIVEAAKPIQILAVWTDCSIYDPIEASQFASAMQKLWPEFRILHGCIEPENALNSRMDFEDWQRTLGISDFQTLFITKTSDELFDANSYDGYTYPNMKIGFYKQEMSNNTYLLSHELLHLGLYELSGGDVVCWSISVHDHYYYGKHPQNIMINAGSGWSKSYGLVEHFAC